MQYLRIAIEVLVITDVTEIGNPIRTSCYDVTPPVLVSKVQVLYK